MLLIRMEKEKQDLKARQHEEFQQKPDLDYEEITPCLKEVTLQWEEMLTEEDRDTRFSPQVVLDCVRKGVPKQLRGEIWYLMVDQHKLHYPSKNDMSPSREYQDLLKDLTEYQHNILIDLGRTFPEHKYFSTQLGPGQLALYNILKAYSLLDRQVGYCQGLSFIAGILLMHMDEPAAFETLRHMMFNLGLRKQFHPSMMPLQIQLYQLTRLIHDNYRDLHDHFEEHEIAPNLYATPWFLTLFASQYPLGFVARVFDLILMQGAEVILKVGLLLLGNHKELILQCNSFESIVEFIKTTLPELGIIQMERIIIQTLIVSLLVSAVQAVTPFARRQLLTHTTRLGEVTGLKIWKYNTTVYQFKKIPYAKPPLTSLRFERPQPIRSWDETLNGTEYGPNCMQYLFENDKRLIPNLKISEDCLHLNIFAPRDLNKTSKRPVMIWIHGGGFTNGQGMMFDGSKLAALYDVIIVTMNYRLNIFGFINVGAGPGRNIGLWDQRFAIKWVKENIMDYGGNSEMITIFGESAGGISVGLQSVIPKNKGLFQRLIAHSGSLLLIRDIDDTEKLTREIGRIFNCSECLNGVQTCLDCLRNISSESLLQKYAAAEHNLQNGFSMNSTIGPIVDGELIPENPIDMLSNSTSPATQMFNSIDYITGTNDCEAGLFYFNLIGQQASFSFELKKGIPSRIVCHLFAPHVSHHVYKACDKVSEEICKKYSPQDKNHSQSQETYQAINAYSDLEFASLAVRDLDFHSRSNKGTYQYLFTHKPTWGLIEDRPTWLVGANHADELEFVFGLEDWFPVNIDISPFEVELSSKMMLFWTTFAKTGNPNPENKQEWPAYDKTTKRFIIFGEYRNSTVDGFHDRMRFWNEDVPKLVSECHQKISPRTPNQAINTTLSAGCCSVVISIRIVVLLLLCHIFIIY